MVNFYIFNSLGQNFAYSESCPILRPKSIICQKMAMFEQLNDQLLKIKFDPSFDSSRLEFCYIIRNHGPKNPPLGCDLGPKFPPHVGRSAKKIDSSSVQTSRSPCFNVPIYFVKNNCICFCSSKFFIRSPEFDKKIRDWRPNNTLITKLG